MKKVYLAAGALAVVGGIAVCVWEFAISPSPRQSLLQASASGFAAGGLTNPVPTAYAQDEIRRLRAELKQKNEVIQNLSARPTASDNAAATVPRPLESSGADRMTHACDILDERMLTAPVDGRSSAEMDRAIRTIVESGTLGQAKVESLHCGGTMCRLNLEGDSDGIVDGATRAFAERTPKLFAGISVFPTKTGKRAIYLAKVGEDLRPDAQE